MRGFMIGLLLTLAGCVDPAEPDYLYTRLMPVPTWYRQAYDDVLACAGPVLTHDKMYGYQKVRFESIMFFVSDVDSFTIKNRGIRTTAMMSGRDIYLARWVVDSTRQVKHEMMHVATEIDGHPNHPFYTCRLMWGQ